MNYHDILGPAYPIHVIDVEHQEELDGWILPDLLEYWQDPECIRSLHTATSSSTLFLCLGTTKISVYQTDFIQSSPWIQDPTAFRPTDQVIL
jgi:hypothetical protein